MNAESLLAAFDVQVLVGGDLMVAQMIICFGSRFLSEDVQRMVLFRPEHVVKF